MTGQSYFQLISPLIFIVFSIGFFAVYYMERQLSSAKAFAISYLACAVGFLLDFFRDAYPTMLTHLPSNLAYMFGAALFATAMTMNYLGDPHVRRIGGLFVASVLVLVTFSLTSDNLSLQTMIVNTMAMIIFGYPLVVLRRMPRRAIDTAIYILLAITALQFPLRTAVVLGIEGDGLTLENYATSLTALTLQFTTSVAGLFLAMSLFIMYGMDLMTRLRLASETDLLTGLKNRRGLETAREKLEIAFDEKMRSHGVLNVDIDHFKGVNDTYGHDVGDLILSRCARVLEEITNGKSIVARIGGEEFQIILPNSDAHATKADADRICEYFASVQHPELHGNSVTVSIGAAQWSKGDAFSFIARLADQALYRAKENGRNQVCVAPGKSHAPVSAKTIRLLSGREKAI